MKMSRVHRAIEQRLRELEIVVFKLMMHHPEWKQGVGSDDDLADLGAFYSRINDLSQPLYDTVRLIPAMEEWTHAKLFRDGMYLATVARKPVPVGSPQRRRR